MALHKIKTYRKCTKDILEEMVSEYWTSSEVRLAKVWRTEHQLTGNALGEVTCNRCTEVCSKENLYRDHIYSPMCVYTKTCITLSDFGYMPLYNGISCIESILAQGGIEDICFVWCPAPTAWSMGWVKELWVKVDSPFAPIVNST